MQSFLQYIANVNYFLSDFLDLCYETKDLGYIKKTEDVVLMYQEFLNQVGVPQTNCRYDIVKIPRWYRLKDVDKN